MGKGVKLLLTRLGSLGAVLAAALTAAVNALSVEGAADDVVTDAGKVLDTAATDHDDGVLLQVVADAGDIGGTFETVGKTDTGDLTKS